ncbi:MAG: SapC family protein [Pseudomonadota bacterium]
MTTDSTDAPDFSGRMLLYKSPVLLSKGKHDGLGLSAVDDHFEFAREATGVPVTLSELVSAQKYYPIVFVGNETPDLAAMLGLPHRDNLFINKSGAWDGDAYVPAYLNCYPFAIARSDTDQAALIFDSASPAISENPEIPFFDGDELHPQVRKRVEFCAQYEADRANTQAFCKRMVELELVSTQSAVYAAPDSDEKESLAEFSAIDIRKLRELGKDTIFDLHENGYLWHIYAHLYSLENWARLASRIRKTRD